MATSTRLSLSEYMKTSYRPDREYVDGELLERNVGKWEHARLQALLAAWLQSQEKTRLVKVATEQRVKVSAARVRIPDVMLVTRGPQPEVIVEPQCSWWKPYRRTTPILKPNLVPQTTCTWAFRAFGLLIRPPEQAASASETPGQPPMY
jgi:hypothetical protein